MVLWLNMKNVFMKSKVKVRNVYSLPIWVPHHSILVILCRACTPELQQETWKEDRQVPQWQQHKGTCQPGPPTMGERLSQPRSWLNCSWWKRQTRSHQAFWGNEAITKRGEVWKFADYQIQVIKPNTNKIACWALQSKKIMRKSLGYLRSNSGICTLFPL